MFELVCIMTTGGVLLFAKVVPRLPDLLTPLVTHILEVRSAQASFEHDSYLVKYTFDTILGLVFVIAWRKTMAIELAEEFLSVLRGQWAKVHPELTIENGVVTSIPQFQERYEKASYLWLKLVQGHSYGRASVGYESPTSEGYASDSSEPPSSPGLSEAQLKANRQSIRSKYKPGKKPEKKNPLTVKSEKPSKVNTKWVDSKITDKERKSLDYSVDAKLDSKEMLRIFTEGGDERVSGFYDSDQQPEEKKEDGLFGRMVKGIKSITGNLVLTEREIIPIVERLKEMLMEKNVAEEVARKMLETVTSELVNSTTKSFTSVEATVREAVRQAVSRVLSSGKQIDIVKEALRAKEKGLLFKVVFIGVNGVGKSTNLAKVAYMLKKQGLSVMLAACDNFRAGAVQQLAVHARALELPIYKKGARDDPVNIAVGAVKEAQITKMDVLLIDTAGRMQEKKALMAQLGRLVTLVRPELVLFIGEALVGNDAIDQLVKFNETLVRESDSRKEIDGIILSKFDTIDKKVGAALTMTYVTGKPIVFVGVGQKYPHLKRLNVATVTEALLS